MLHPEFVDGKYALYTRPQDGFIDAGSGGGISWALIDDITHAVIKKEIVIEQRHYHTIKEVKNGEGPHPIKTPQGWLHLAHGVRACAAGLRYVLYLYMTSLDDPRKVIAQPGGYFMAPVGEETDARSDFYDRTTNRLLPAYTGRQTPFHDFREKHIRYHRSQ